jgi:hypothetical protein
MINHLIVLIKQDYQIGKINPLIRKELYVDISYGCITWYIKNYVMFDGNIELYIKNGSRFYCNKKFWLFY